MVLIATILLVLGATVAAQAEVITPFAARFSVNASPTSSTPVPSDLAYSPLRRISLVNWQPDATPRLLRSADELTAASDAGEVTITRTETVVNMPILSWPTGHR